ncbi:MAG: DUF1512 family protein [Candidatus Aenigmatarchaeota archaeon]
MQLLQTDIFGTVLWFVILFIFIIVYPRIMLSQMIWKIEQSARKIEELSDKANNICAKRTNIHTKEMKEKITEFTDFFIVEPSSLDPYGIVQKIDQLIRQTEDRFTEFVDEHASKHSAVERQQLNYGLRAAIGLRQISKIVRHNVELAKRFKNLQIAMIIQMQLPIIEKFAESELKGTESFLNGWPVGDSIGPMFAASLIDEAVEIAPGTVAGHVKIEGRECFVLKAKGPEPHLGRTDEAVNKLMKKHNFSRIITIDAGLKLEGEQSGKVAEGVGFAMGGYSQRELIENVLLPKKKPIDGIIVKVGLFDAIAPMPKEVLDSIPKVYEALIRSIKRTKPKEKVLIIGVGNSSGIGNDKKAVESVKELIIKNDKKIKEEEKASKKGSWL